MRKSLKIGTGLWTAALSLLVAGLLGDVARGAENVAASIRQLTGAHTRLVWVRGANHQGDKFGGGGAVYRLVALDTDDGGQERYLVPDIGAHTRPMITPSGRRVIWTDGDKTIWIINWDGKNRKKLLGAECGVGVAEDPPGVEWVYVAEGAAKPEGYIPIVRYQIDNLSKKELVWDKTPSIDKWEFTRDGKYGASRYPATVASVSLPNGEFKPVAQIGCTPGISADAKDVFHMITVSHAGIILYDRDGGNKRVIDFTKGPPEKGLGHGEFWWTSFVRYDARFMTFAGPYQRDRPFCPGKIYFCKLNEKRDGFSDWIRVCDDSEVNLHPYGWIESGNAYGPSPTDKLTVKLLAATVRKFSGSDPFKPTLDELQKAAADGANAARAAEARRIVDHILGWGRHTLRIAQGQETTDLPAAVKTYKVLAANYAGLDIGDEAKKKLDDPGLAKDLEAWPKTQTEAAQKLETEKPPEAEAAYKAILEKFPDSEFAKAARARLDDPGFKRQLTAWAHLKTIQKAEALFVTVPGAKAQASDKAWGGRNAARLSTIRTVARTLKKDFADTAAWKEAEKILVKYGIDLEKK
jgi:hypothetical protein